MDSAADADHRAIFTVTQQINETEPRCEIILVEVKFSRESERRIRIRRRRIV